MASSCNDKDLDCFLPFYRLPTPEKFKQVAEKEICETETLKEEGLSALKTLIKNSDVACISSDDFLLRFLRCHEFDVQESFRTLRNYSRFRISVHEKILKLKPELVKTCVDHKLFGFLPYRDAEERLYIFTKPAFWNAGICSFEELQTVLILFANYLVENQMSQVAGIVSIQDGRNAPFSYVLYTIPYLNFWTHFLLECVPVRYQAFHLVYTSKLLKVIISLLNPLIPKKLKDKFFFHETMVTLHEHISPDLLPEELGGNLGPLDNSHLSDSLTEFVQRMKDEQRYFLQRN